jgi:hypothetical protein
LLESLFPFPAWGQEMFLSFFPICAHFYPIILNFFPNKLYCYFYYKKAFVYFNINTQFYTSSLFTQHHYLVFALVFEICFYSLAESE